MTTPQKKWFIRGAIAVAVIAVALTLWQMLKPGGLPDGIIGGNGRIEAIEIDISAKTPWRIRAFVAYEGDFVKDGQVVAPLETHVLTDRKSVASGKSGSVRVDT